MLISINHIFSKAQFIKARLSVVFTEFNQNCVLKIIFNSCQDNIVSAHLIHIVNAHFAHKVFKFSIKFSLSKGNFSSLLSSKKTSFSSKLFQNTSKISSGFISSFIFSTPFSFWGKGWDRGIF